MRRSAIGTDVEHQLAIDVIRDGQTFSLAGGAGTVGAVSDAGFTPPPPPPPNLTPPPGYAGYAPTLGSAVPLRRLGGLRTAILVLLAVYAVAAAIAIAVLPAMVDAADQFLASGRTDADEDRFLEQLGPFVITSLLTGLATLAIFVLSIIWLHRIVSNHRSVGRNTSWSPGWAIGSWFVPPLIVYAVPMLVLRESWKASDPAVSPGDDGWRTSAVNPVVYVWWALYGLAPIVFLVAGVTIQAGTFGSQDTEDLADFLGDRMGFSIAQSVIGIAAAIAWALLVRGLSARHTLLTGEAAPG